MLSFIVIMFLAYLIWRKRNLLFKPYSCSLGCDVGKEYKGILFQLVSIKTDKKIYEISFQTQLNSIYWKWRKYTYEREQFVQLIDSIDRGLAGRFDSLNGRVIEVVASPLSRECVLHLSSSLNWQQYILERKVINAIISDFKNSVI